MTVHQFNDEAVQLHRRQKKLHEEQSKKVAVKKVAAKAGKIGLAGLMFYVGINYISSGLELLK